MKRKNLGLALLATALVGCNGYFSDMDIKSTTSPDIEIVMGDASQYPSIINGSFSKQWSTLINHNSGGIQIACNADAVVTAWGNWNGIPYTYDYKTTNNGTFKSEIGNTDVNGGSLTTVWVNSYSVINNMRNILYMLEYKKLKYMVSGEDQTHIIKANAYYLLGSCYTELALLFDRAFVVDPMIREGIDSTYLLPATEVQKTALNYLDQAIALCDANTFTNFNIFPGTVLANNVKLGRMARFMAARALAYLPRNKDQVVDWTKVSSYLKGGKGLDEDYKISFPAVGWDGSSAQRNSWTGGNSETISAEQQYCRLSPRIVQMMADLETEADRKALWPLRSTFFAANVNNKYDRVKSSDVRLNGPNNDNENSDFKYTLSYTATGSAVKYNTYTTYTPYAFVRGTKIAEPGNIGDVICYLKAESDLLEAEAILRTEGANASVATLINKTRTTRGGLTDITGGSSAAEMEHAIFYEKMVEGVAGNLFLPLYERRRTKIAYEGLTPYSFREFPLPMKELNQWSMLTYTYGGKIGVGSLFNATTYDYKPIDPIE